jgi:segregation and condensation protein B
MTENEEPIPNETPENIPVAAPTEHAGSNPKFAELEALLFYYGEPMEAARIGTFLGLKTKECEALLAEWGDSLTRDDARGLELLRNGNAVQLVTKSSLKSIGEKLVKEEFREELTPAGLETLSLIAYLGPISRPRIDYIRGVNSSFIVRNLLMRGLIEREHGDEKGHLFEYRTSMEFLKHMGLPAAEKLPEYETFHALLTEFETQRTESSKLEEQPAVSIEEPAS